MTHKHLVLAKTMFSSICELEQGFGALTGKCKRLRIWCPMQKYIYTRFPSETVTRSGYQVSCSCSLYLLFMLIATCTLRSVRAAEFAAHTWYP